jgi:hypothetical protein
MNLRSRVDSLLSRAVSIQYGQDETILIPVGVWFLDENGDIIENSGRMSRVLKCQKDIFGILAASEPVSKEDFQDRAKICRKWQAEVKENYEKISSYKAEILSEKAK